MTWSNPKDATPTPKDGLPWNKTKVLVKVVRSNGAEQFCGFYLEKDPAKFDPNAFDDSDIGGLKVVLWRALTPQERVLAKSEVMEDQAERATRLPGFHPPQAMRIGIQHVFCDSKIHATGWSVSAKVPEYITGLLRVITDTGSEKSIDASDAEKTKITAWRLDFTPTAQPARTLKI